MQTQPQGVEKVTLSEVLGMASWERQRTDEELRAFIEKRHQALGDVELEV